MEGNVPFVPEEAVVTFAGIVKVYVITEGKAEERRVTTGQRRDGWIEILEGVKVGEAVATSGLSHPVTIMLSLSLAHPLALLTPAATSQTLNLNSIIGIFLLMGVVKKNSILQGDYTNTLRERGVERFQAILEANHARLRPILMTALSIVFGMVPIAFGRGDGAAGRASMATVVIGGQMLSLLLTLLATPVFCSLFDDLGTPRWDRASLRGSVSAWNRFRYGWSRVEQDRHPEVS